MPEPMPAAEARDVLARLGWSQLYAAERLGVAPRTMRYWLARDGTIPAPAAELLRVYARQGE
jgi:DNA-binding transcriptional regulator YiaG